MLGAAAMSPSAPPRDPRRQTQLLLRKARSHRIALDHVGPDPTFADMIVGFHAQQAIEKLIKAVLSHHQITYPRVNDLDRLIHLLDQNRSPSRPARSSWEASRPGQPTSATKTRPSRPASTAPRPSR